MKRFITIFLLHAAIVCLAANSVEILTHPRQITAKEPAELILRTKASVPPSFVKLPEVPGLTWLGSGTSIQQQYVNGRHSIVAERRYSFVVEKEGSYTIPETTINVNRKQEKIKPYTINVKKSNLRTQNTSGEEISIDKAVFAKIFVPEGKNTYFVGEYIPVEVQVFCLSGEKINLGYPKISSGSDDIIYRNYQDVNKENPYFDRPRRTMERIDGRDYICYIFRTEIKTIVTGKLDLKVQAPTEIMVPSSPGRRMSSDPFFDDFFNMGYSYRKIQHTARSEAPELMIKPLPAQPENTYFLGLTGNWKLTSNLSSDKTSVGNAIVLTLTVTGEGGLEGLHPPELKIQNFRVYSPEISKNSNSAEIRYTLIPVKTGKIPIDAKFCTFNTKTGTYDICKVAEEITVETNKGIIPVAPGSNVVDTAIPESQKKEQEEHALAGIMYLKKISDGDTAQKDYFSGWLIGIIGFGILAVIICEILAFFLRGTSTAANRRAAAGKQKKILMKKLKESHSEQVYDLVPEISEYVNNALDLSPGTSLDESAQWIGQKNPELSEELKKLSAGAWAPGAEEFSVERKQRLSKMLAKLVIMLLFMFAPFVIMAEETQDEIIKAYDAGNFKEAREWYMKKLEKSGISPALLYNIGNCYYQEKDFAKALLCYEKAHLLAPRDEAIFRNLELTRRELKLPAVNQLNSPSDIPSYLRDQMTPEEWMIIAAIGLSFLLIAFGLRRFTGPRVTLPIMIVGAIILILGSAMTFSLYKTTYSTDRAIVLEDDVQIRTLPSKQSPLLNNETLKSAETVQIRERRNDWIRIKAGNVVGWVPAGSIGQINGSEFSVF